MHVVETMRAPRQDEAQAVTDLVVACDVHELGAPDFELDDLLTDWNMPGFDLALDAVVVEDDRRLVAYAAFNHAFEIEGMNFALFVIVLAAAEAAVALAIVLNFYNNHMTVDVDTAEELKG